MPNPNAIVSTVVRIDPPLDRPAAETLRAGREFSVELEDGRTVRLDPGDPRSAGFAQVLEGLARRRLPVYLEVDPGTETVTRLLVPRVTRVVGVRPLDQGVLAVELDRSHARHVLRREAPEFEELERAVREALRSGAPVVLTEDDGHRILDVRGYKPGPEGPVPPFPLPELPPRIPLPWRWIRELLDRLWLWPWWPWWWFRCVSAARAQQVFDAMAATSCDPVSVPAPCIPFLYPDDGCWARAHEMCRLMKGMGVSSKKVWIQGSLYVATRNSPACGVWWGWHVAPTLCVRGPRLFQKREMVIDPSLFAAPVTRAEWKGVQGDPGATLTDTSASIYYLWGSVTDPAYTETNFYLDFYRLQLQARAAQHGPPPYAHCP